MISSLQLAEMWQSLGYEVHVLCLGRKEAFFPDDERKASSITAVPDFFIKDPFNYGISFSFFVTLWQLLKTLKPKYIVVNKILFWTSISILPLRILGYRVILMTDALVGITWWGRTRLFRICSAIYAWTLGWLILRLATAVVFFHPQPESILRTLGISQKSSVIPSTIDDKKLKSFSRKKNDVFTALYIGRLESVKGVDDLLAVAQTLHEKGERIRWRIAGSYSHIPDVVARYPYVEFLGLQLDTPPLFERADVFIMPSYAEGLSNALLEALGTGTPCIGTDVGGTSFLLSGGCGLLFQPSDRNRLLELILKVKNEPALAERLSNAGLAKFRTQFTREAVGKNWLELFGRDDLQNHRKLSSAA